ncbi:hypothetical protein ABZ926_29035 [Streptomyces litmocidini]|uniref:Integral membrane protein n=1 Tax=Streptomyces litmocidini TaxID=67318 RepID=A0ABW7U9S9_9ACTN|nr:hypothetical protein [Streptomyces sp. PanSC19]ROQ33910.1 hypothetical protein EDD98_2942 [Streptomyces sp. PanSC19]
MSFGEPNNPYGQPQGQQPGYGYPQQAPQGVPQQGYGYPAAPPYGGGYPGAAMQMPGGVKAARVMLWIFGVLQILMGILMALAGGWFADQLSSSSSEFDNTDGAAAAVTGIFVVIGIFVLAFGVWAIMMAVKSATGGNGVRISAIVYGSLSTLGSLVNLVGGNVFALVSLALGILIIVFYAKSDAAAWFKRNRQQY